MTTQVPEETPIYDSVVKDQKWSPDMLDAPFDLATFIRESYDKVQGVKRGALKSVKAPVKKRTPRKR